MRPAWRTRIRLRGAVRVMGPWIATGAAAAHALDLAEGGSLHAIGVTQLGRRLAHNVFAR